MYVFHKERIMSGVSYITCLSRDKPKPSDKDRPEQIPKPELNYPNSG